MLKGKHITFIGLNYAPEDTAIGLYSTQMVKALTDAGAIVNVVTAFPYYPQWQIAPEYQDQPDYIQEQHQSATLYRYKQYVPESPSFIKRIIHLLSFTKGSYYNLKKIKHADLVISIIPFTSSAWLAGRHAQKHGAKNWIHIQDFEFDAAQQSGLSNGGMQLLFKYLFKLEKHLLNQADIVSTISHNMIAKLKTKTNQPSYYLPNWIDDNQVNPASATSHNYLRSDKFKLLYSGNVGDKQDWDFFYAFAKALPPQHYDIIIVGAGSKYNLLKQTTKQQNIHYYDPVPYADLSNLLCSADAHFLFQKTEILDTVMPSKLLGMMASGKPSLVLGNPKSEVKQVLQKSNAGCYLESADVNAAVNQLEQWRLNHESTQQIGLDARRYVTQHFASKPILDQWIHQLKELLES